VPVTDSPSKFRCSVCEREVTYYIYRSAPHKLLLVSEGGLSFKIFRAHTCYDCAAAVQMAVTAALRQRQRKGRKTK
jgi:hypothetical protein